MFPTCMYINFMDTMLKAFGPIYVLFDRFKHCLFVNDDYLLKLMSMCWLIQSGVNIEASSNTHHDSGANILL